MRIEYNILWVEDDNSWYKTTSALFLDVLEDLGFRLNCKRCTNLDEVKEEVRINNLQDYDMLLVDYTLKNSESGDKIINFLRHIQNNPILTDVLFYSSSVENVRDSMRNLGLEGVYTADRRDIETKFELVLKTSIKKIQEVNTMRGLIMAETSDLDDLMSQIASKLLSSSISKEISQYIDENIDDTIKFVSDLFNKLSHNDKIKDSRLYTTSHKARTINKLYKLKKIGVDKFYEDYNNKVIIPRNIFAHVREKVEDGVKVLVSDSIGKKEVFTEARCIEIRKDLIIFREHLEGIKKVLDDNLC